MLGIVLGLGAAAGGKNARAAGSKSGKRKPNTITIKAEPFKITIGLDGIFLPVKFRERVLRPRTWQEFTVTWSVPHGARVKAGGRLVTFDHEPLDEKLEELATTLKITGLEIRRGKEAIEHLEKSLELDLAIAERSYRLAAEDLKRFKDIFSPSLARWAKFEVETIEDYLSYEEEELKQLEKMYKEDELTEETEEIVLKRQKDYIHRLKFYLEEAGISRDQRLEVELPRKQKTLENKLEKATLGLGKLKLDLPATIKAKKLELAQQELQYKRSREQLAKLKQDRQLMTVTAPAAGIVYYGRFRKGKWAPEEAERVLEKGSRVRAHQVFITIVNLRPLDILAKVPEKELQLLKKGLEARVKPACALDIPLTAKLAEISGVPVSSGTFTAKFPINLPPDAKRIVPGMKCRLELVPYRRDKAITVPNKNLFADKLDESKRFVWLWKKDAKPEKRYVKTGKATKETTEILEGLKDGDEILKTPPADEDKAKGKDEDEDK